MKNHEIVEIQLNPNGILWAELLENGARQIGRVHASDAEEIIRRVADIYGIKITAEHPVIEADIPSARMRFTGVLPPITDNPAFAIRKMAADD